MKALFQAAFVIARRDFTAIIFSKTFLFFLLGPLFPLVVGIAAGSLGERMASESLKPSIAVLVTPSDAVALRRAHARLVEQIGARSLPELYFEAGASDDRTITARLSRTDNSVLAVLSGTLAKPRLTGKAGDVERMRGDVSLLVSTALAGNTQPLTILDTRIVAESRGSEKQTQLLVGRGAQVILFLLTMLLAGMVLSNMVEEKTNKVIEILAAAVPIDAIFIGKLMAMLAMSFVGIAFWGAGALIGILAYAGPGAISLPAPAVGWPLFVLLGIIYFAMAYTLLGSLFIGIGAQATTVREVQTLSMPITMGQVVIFFFASYAVNRMGEAPEVASAIFPFSSPFAMIARAAQSPDVTQHLIAIGWQALWVAIIIRIGVGLFRRNVLKSGPGEKSSWRLFGRAKAKS